MLPKHKADNQS